MRRVVLLTGRHRAPSINRVLGLILAFNAGAINAGGFLVVHMYTSHMTGFVSTLADNVVLGNMLAVLAATGALIAFLSGAASTAVIVNWARQHHLRSGFAIPLLLEALLMLVFGLVGAVTLETRTPFAVPLTVLLLSFLMGLQNAVVSKMSGSQIRTTHMTGVVTDLGMELGKFLYWNRSGIHANAHVHANKPRLRLYASLLGVFFVGGLVGATAFKRVGFVWVLPLAFALLTVSLPPLLQDFKRSPFLWDLAKRIVPGFKRL